MYFSLLQTVWRQRLPLAKSGLLSVDKALVRGVFATHHICVGGEKRNMASCYLNVKKNYSYYLFFFRAAELLDTLACIETVGKLIIYFHISSSYMCLQDSDEKKPHFIFL